MDKEITGITGLKPILSEDDFDKLKSVFKEKNTKLKLPESMSEDAYYGVIGDLVNKMFPHSEAAKEAILINMITAFGNIIGNKAYFLVEGTKHHMKIYPVLVGATSKARKGTSWGYPRELFISIDNSWGSRLANGLSSGEGLIWHVRDPIEKEEFNKSKNKFETKISDKGVEDKRLLVVEEEFAQLLKVISRQGNTISPTVREAWDHDYLQSMTKNSAAVSNGAHISIMGHITQTELKRYLSPTEQGNGFSNRFLFFLIERSKLLPHGGSFFEEEDVESELIRLKEAVDFGKKGGRIKWADETVNMWERIYPELSEGKEGIIGSLTARSEAYVTRLSCIYALSDKSLKIYPEHLKAAIAILDYSISSVNCIFGADTGDPIAEKILKHLRSNPEGLSRTEINKKLSGHINSEQISESLEILSSTNKAKSESITTEGRSANIWKIIYED